MPLVRSKGSGNMVVNGAASSEGLSFLVLAQELSRSYSKVDISETTRLMVQKFSAAFGYEGAAVYVLDAGGETLSLRAAHGIPDQVLPAVLDISHPDLLPVLSGRAHPLSTADSFQPSLFESLRRDLGFAEVLLLPILSREEVMGVMPFFSHEKVVLSLEETATLSALLELAGVTIENSCLFLQQARHLSFLQALNDITKVISSTQTLDDVLDHIVRLLPRVLDLKGCTIRLLNPQDRRLELVAAFGLSREYLNRGDIASEKAVHEVFSGLRPVIIHDATQDPRVQFREEAEKEGIGSILSVPILAGDSVLGVLRLLTAKPRVFSEIEIDLAVAVAEHGGIAMKKALDYRRISTLLAEIEQQEDFLESIIDNVNAGLMILDHSKRIVLANSRFLRQEGLSSEDVMGKYPWEILPFLSSRTFPLETTHAGEGGLVVEDRGKGTPRHLEISAVSFNPPGRGNNYSVVIIRDVTATKLLESETRERERLQGVIEMARTVAHELNTPIFVALGALDLLEEDLPAESPLREDCQDIRSNLTRLSGLITRMTQITQYQAREYAGDVTMVDLERSAPEKRMVPES